MSLPRPWLPLLCGLLLVSASGCNRLDVWLSTQRDDSPPPRLAPPGGYEQSGSVERPSSFSSFGGTASRSSALSPSPFNNHPAPPGGVPPLLPLHGGIDPRRPGSPFGAPLPVVNRPDPANAPGRAPPTWATSHNPGGDSFAAPNVPPPAASAPPPGMRPKPPVRSPMTAPRIPNFRFSRPGMHNAGGQAAPGDVPPSDQPPAE